MRTPYSCSDLPARVEIAMASMQTAMCGVSQFDHGLLALEMMRQINVMEKIVTKACLRLSFTGRI